MYLIIILLMLGIGGNVFAQAPDTLWTRTFGSCSNDWCRSGLVDSSGKIIVTGESYGHQPQSSDMGLFIFAPLSMQLDTQYFGQVDDDEYGRSVYRHDENHIAVFGMKRARPTTAYYKFTFIVTPDLGGNEVLRYYGGADGAHEYLSGALDIGHSGYVLYGSTGSFGTWGSDNLWIIRINQVGDSIWSFPFGDAAPEFSRGACICPDSTMIVVGDRWYGNQWSPTFVHFNTSGEILHGGLISTPFNQEYIHDAIAISDSTFAFCGEVDNQARVYIADLGGNVLWSVDAGYETQSSAEALLLLNDGNIAVAGNYVIPNSNPDIFVWCLSANGDSLWTYTLPLESDDRAADLRTNSFGNLFLFGSSTRGCSGSWDNFVICLGPASSLTGITVDDQHGSLPLSIFSTDTIRWTGVGFDGGVSIELNRHYLIGAWETITDSTENDGAYEWFVTDPLSDSCRIRICALQDTFCDVSDGNFSIVSSQGYLALVRSSQANAPLTGWNFGAVECPSAASQWFRFKNFGSESIVVFQPLEPASSEFSRTTPCEAFFALAPNQMSACSVRVVFDAASDGLYTDVLRVQTDAVNGVNGFVEFALAGEQISTPAAPEVVITTAGLDAHLSWSVVDTSIGGCAVTGLWYAVFYSPTSGGPFYYHGWTPQTTYTHSGVVNFSATQFYQVVAVEGPVALAGSLVRGMEMGEVLGKIRNEKLEMGKAE